MSAARDRKEASKRIGLLLQAKHRKLIDATTPEEINDAAVDLGVQFNSNIEFICWVLKEYGGVEQRPITRNKKALPKTPGILLQ